MPSNLARLVDEIVAFRDKRDWAKFHNSKDLALALSIEASELNELFLWKQPEDVNRKRIEEELADVLVYSLLLAHKHDIDVFKSVRKKMRINARKYPVKKSRGNATKYTML